MLKIKNWNEHYETAETRKLGTLHWVKIPNQQDSLAYRLIASHKRGAEIFAAWVLMVQVASKGKREERGNLPLSPDELGIVTGFPAEIFRLAIDVLKTPKIGWIVESPDEIPSSPDASGKNPTSPPAEGMEEKEEKEGKNMAPVGAWFSDQGFAAAWKAWERARKKKAGERQYKRLETLSGGDMGKAITILNQSADNQWQGLFEIKGVKSGTYRQTRAERLDSDAEEFLREFGWGAQAPHCQDVPAHGDFIAPAHP